MGWSMEPGMGGPGTEPGREPAVNIPQSALGGMASADTASAGMVTADRGVVDHKGLRADRTRAVRHTTVVASLHYADILLGEVGEILIFIAHRCHVYQFMS